MGFDFKARIKRLRARLKAEGLHALISVTLEDSNRNPYYLSGFSGTTGALVVTQREAVLAVDPRYIERAKAEAKGVRIAHVPRGLLNRHFSLYIEKALEATTLSAKSRVGFEAARVPHAWVPTWKKTVKGKLTATEHIVERLRQIKDADELRHLAHASRVTSRVFLEVSKKIRAGMTEREIARMLDIAHLRAGAVASSFRTIVASGKNSALPHHETSDRTVKAGEPLILDFGGLYSGGYCSDLTRTIFVPGKPPDKKLADMYRVALAANHAALKALRAGMTWKEYDAVAREHIDAGGYGKYFTHGLGHSIGLETHDPYDYRNDPFEAGTVLSNEPGIYIPGVGGVRIEDDVVVTARGAKRLTNAPYLSL